MNLQPASEYKRRHELSLYYRLLALVDAEIDLTDDPIELSGLLDERAGCVMDATELGGRPDIYNARRLPFRKTPDGQVHPWQGDHQGAPVLLDPRDVLSSDKPQGDIQTLLHYVTIRRREQAAKGKRHALQGRR